MRIIPENDTTLFLLCGLGIERAVLNKQGFVSAFIKDDQNDIEYNYPIYLLFRPESIEIFQNFLEGLYQSSLKPVDDYDYKGYVVVVYSFPKNYRREYNMFLKGQFSKFRAHYKLLLPHINENSEQKFGMSLQLMVCNKMPSLKRYLEIRLGVQLDSDDELWFKPKIKRETLNIEKYGKEHYRQLGKSMSQSVD